MFSDPKEFDPLVLTDLVFNTKMTNKEIAQLLGFTEKEVAELIKDLGIGWIRRYRGQASRGQAALTALMRKLLPGVEVRTEEHIGERLKLDVYCPRYKLAAEFHGRQHFEFTPFFHDTYEDFLHSQERDARKLEICKQLGIVLVVFRYTDDLTEESVYMRLLDAVRAAPAIPKEEKKTIKGNPFYENAMKRRREQQKKAYQRMKDRKRSHK